MFKIAAKDLRLFIKDRRSVMLTFILPIFLISIFALAFGGARREAAKPSTLLIADLDRSETTAGIIARLDSLKSLEVHLILLDSAQEEVKKGYEPAVLVLYKGFEDSVNAGRSLPMELQYDPAKEMEIGILQQALMSNLYQEVGTRGMKDKVMKQVNEQYADLDSATLEGIRKQVEANFSRSGQEQQEASGEGGLKMTALVKEKESGPGLIQAVAGTAIMMLLFSVAGIGGSILAEKEEGTLKKLLYSPMNANNILFGKLLASVCVAIIQLAVMFVFASFVFKLDLTVNIPGLLAMIVASAFACAGFGIFLASIARSRQQLQGLSTLVVLTMSAIGGSMIPTFIMPVWMQKVSVLSVNYWSIQGFYDIFWRERPLMEILLKAGVLVAIGTVLTLIAVRLFRKNVLKLM